MKGVESNNSYYTTIELKEPKPKSFTHLLSKFENLKPALQTDPHHLTVLVYQSLAKISKGNISKNNANSPSYEVQVRITLPT